MSIEVHIDWEGTTRLVGLLRPAARLSPGTISAYASAFEDLLIDEAASLLGA